MKHKVVFITNKTTVSFFLLILLFFGNTLDFYNTAVVPNTSTRIIRIY